MQSSKLQFKIKNLRIWKLIENWKLPVLSEAEGKIENSSEGGYVAISIMLILTAVILGIIVTVAHLGIGEGQASLALSKGEDTLHFVEGCTEDALLKIRSNSAYAGGTITRPEGTCTITVTTGNPNWNITVSTNATTYKRSVIVIFTRNPTGITLTSWKEQ